MQRRSTNTKQTPDGKSQHKPANVHLTGRESGTNWHKLAASPAQTLQHWRVFLETKTTIFFPGLLHPTYVNEKIKNMEKKHIFILLYRRDTRNQDTTGALFTRKQDVGNRVTVFSSSMQTSSSWDDDWAEDRIIIFFNIKRCFVLFTPHSTRLGSTESIWKNLYNRHQI